jgi:hypothetical protein
MIYADLEKGLARMQFLYGLSMISFVYRYPDLPSVLYREKTFLFDY